MWWASEINRKKYLQSFFAVSQVTILFILQLFKIEEFVLVVISEATIT
jgi:hypothetical protein